MHRLAHKGLFQFVKILPPTKVPELSFDAQQGLFLQLIKKNARTVVDVYPRPGASTLFLAPRVDTVLTVEPWYSEEKEIQQFLSNIIHAKLTDKVIPWFISNIFDDVDLVHINQPTDGLQIEPWVNHRSICGSGTLTRDAATYLTSYAQTRHRKLVVTNDFWCLE